MIMRLAFLAVMAIFAGDNGIRVVDVKGLQLGEAKGTVEKPLVISSAEELAKAISDPQSQAAIKKHVDFSKEKVLYFAWAGSGQDKLTYNAAKTVAGLQMTLTYQPGLTRDLRQHHQLFIVPQSTTWKLDRAK